MPTSTRYPVRPCCPVSGGLKPSPTFRFVGGGTRDAPYRTIVTCTGLRILQLWALPSAQNDMAMEMAIKPSLSLLGATQQSVSPGIVTPSVGEGLDPPDTGSQYRTG